MKHIVCVPIFVIAMLISFGSASAQLIRPTPMGLGGSNGAVGQDATVPDQDVAQAISVGPNLGMTMAYCAIIKGINIDGVAIDLSVSPAALDVVVDSTADLDPDHLCIPASFAGIPVEQDVIPTVDDATSSIFVPN